MVYGSLGHNTAILPGLFVATASILAAAMVPSAPRTAHHERNPEAAVVVAISGH